jgi:hypothetical protein
LGIEDEIADVLLNGRGLEELRDWRGFLTLKGTVHDGFPGVPPVYPSGGRTG